MVFIKKRTIQLLKWMLVAAIIVIVVYTFRDSAVPVLNELKQTTFAVALCICAMAVAYHILEGFITTVLARQYQPGFRLWTGIKNAFICSFYRVATLGSGAGVAALVYLGEHGISYSTGFGLYMTQYAVHKSSIALFSMLFFVLCFPFMQVHYAEYQWLLAAGYVLTAAITLVLMLFACSVRFHKLLLTMLSFLNDKMKGRFTEPLMQLKEQCRMLEESSHVLLGKPRVMAGIAVLNLIKFCFFYAIPYLSFYGQGSITLVQTMAVTSLSVMLAAVLPSPAGIGSTEFVFTTLLTKIVGTGAAGSSALLYRFGTFVFPFLVGGVIVIVRRIRRHTGSGRQQEENDEI